MKEFDVKFDTITDSLSNETKLHNLKHEIVKIKELISKPVSLLNHANFEVPKFLYCPEDISKFSKIGHILDTRCSQYPLVSYKKGYLD